ncbi:hydroxymethylbilane synthase [Iodidimonas sp. SYSU 1G8]|uniref:hydroxymethylbilane synthase n=1 Tax=Iodidimonas sp. SYSU 1G8 TaxID=3133967 RepID=UPI0031FE7575
MSETTRQRPVRIGTRSSPLALAQAHEVKQRLLAAHTCYAESDIEIVPMSTKGDRIQNRALSELGGKGLFTEEIENGLLDGSLDIAVHSMKDMPTVLPDGLGIICMLEREDVRDTFISDKAPSLAALAPGALVGTASLRRQAQVLRQRPDLRVETFRGNVQTRLRKLHEGVADATLLALAGLNRLGMTDVATAIIDSDTMLPAIAQGALGIEARLGDAEMSRLLLPLDHAGTRHCVNAERALLAALDGSCRTPIAGLATLRDGRIRLRGEILTPDGRLHHTTEREGPVSDAAAMGWDAGEELRRRGGPDFFRT